MNRSLSVVEPESSPRTEGETARYAPPESSCPYLAGRSARYEAYLVETLDPGAYERLLGMGFRRSGRVIYRPRCLGCRECRQLRVPTASFETTRSMRRIARRNADVRAEVGRPAADERKFAVYSRYLESRHDGTMSRDRNSFEDFLYDSPTDTLEFMYWLGDRLIGVSIADRVPGGLSSVYMYFDPDFASRSLGTFSILWEIEYCRREGLDWYYLGYFVAGSGTMAYKARFRPNELLAGDETWVAFRGRGGA